MLSWNGSCLLNCHFERRRRRCLKWWWWWWCPVDAGNYRTEFSRRRRSRWWWWWWWWLYLKIALKVEDKLKVAGNWCSDLFTHSLCRLSGDCWSFCCCYWFEFWGEILWHFLGCLFEFCDFFLFLFLIPRGFPIKLSVWKKTVFTLEINSKNSFLILKEEKVKLCKKKVVAKLNFLVHLDLSIGYLGCIIIIWMAKNQLFSAAHIFFFLYRSIYSTLDN